MHNYGYLFEELDHCAYIASMGDNKMVISTKKGKEIINPLLVK